MSVIKMKRSSALEWVRLGIVKGNYETAIEILDSLIEQEKKAEEEELRDKTRDNLCWGCEYRKTGELDCINICLLDDKKECVREEEKPKELP